MAIVEASIAEGFKLVVAEIFDHIKTNSKPNLNIENAYLKASKVEEVKTIWQVDKEVNLNAFYYPSKISVEGKDIRINSLADFPENGKVVIQGTAGQGKSIFLRYLSGTELKEGNTVPVFVELRKISESKSIEQLILNNLSNLGIECNAKSLNYIFESNKCTLLLDAFDEIKSELIQDTISYLDDLCSKFHNLRIIISSRPNSEVQHVTHFRVFDLCPLTELDFPKILNKLLCHDSNTEAEELVKAIENNKSGISELLTTPLLITLLLITYKSYNRVPEKLHEFYENLFSLLVNRHDATKPGFSREFRSELNENQLEELFCAFCFYCMLNGKNTFSRQNAISMVKDSKLITGIEPKSESSFLEDSKKNTCLILEEGFEYHFIHKSIKEYHSAKFISSSPLQLKEEFYKLALKKPSDYRQEVSYLQQIDKYYCCKLFIIPSYVSLFDAFSYKNSSIKDSNIIFNKVEAMIQPELGIGGLAYNDNIIHSRDRFFNGSRILIAKLIFEENVFSEDFLKKEEINKSNTTTYCEITSFIKEEVKSDIIECYEKYLLEKYKEYESTLQFIKEHESAINSIKF